MSVQNRTTIPPGADDLEAITAMAREIARGLDVREWIAHQAAEKIGRVLVEAVAIEQIVTQAQRVCSGCSGTSRYHRAACLMEQRRGRVVA